MCIRDRIAAACVLLSKLPAGLTFSDTLALAGGYHKLEAVDFSLSVDRRYTFWSGLLGGLFLALSYFGTDQSQVQRYLSGASLRESRLGLMFNAVLKIPMQFFILLLGVLIFVFYRFERPPVFFNQTAWDQQVEHDATGRLRRLDTEFAAAHADERRQLQAWLDARRAGDRPAETAARLAADEAHGRGQSARAEIGGASYDTGRIAIGYPHIPPQLLQPPARLKAVSLDLAIRGHRVGYLPGAGDSVASSLEQMGFEVTRLTGADLTQERLKDFDAVVTGVRAFNTRTDLVAGLPALFAYVEAGGTLVEQYNTPNGLQTQTLAPYMLKLSRDLPRFRVTDENSAVTLLAPANPALTTPNRIIPEDFEGWVQERGLNFSSEWDSAHFTALLACSDAGEAPLKGCLLYTSRCV